MMQTEQGICFMVSARHLAQLTAVLAVAVPSSAQSQIVGTGLADISNRASARSFSTERLPAFQAPVGDLRSFGVPARSGLIAAVPLRRNLDIGVGRFQVSDHARPRSYMESERQPTTVRTRDRGIAAVGVSVRF